MQQCDHLLCDRVPFLAVALDRGDVGRRLALRPNQEVQCDQLRADHPEAGSLEDRWQIGGHRGEIRSPVRDVDDLVHHEAAASNLLDDHGRGGGDVVVNAWCPNEPTITEEGTATGSREDATSPGERFTPQLPSLFECL